MACGSGLVSRSGKSPDRRRSRPRHSFRLTCRVKLAKIRGLCERLTRYRDVLRDESRVLALPSGIFPRLRPRGPLVSRSQYFELSPRSGGIPKRPTGQTGSVICWLTPSFDRRVRSTRFRKPKFPEGYPSGQRGQTVNLLAYAFGGSNPPPSTSFKKCKKVCRGGFEPPREMAVRPIRRERIGTRRESGAAPEGRVSGTRRVIHLPPPFQLECGAIHLPPPISCNGA